ncbi:hypothetical protein [Rhodococcus sp. X156]|uniref:aa3-type cytochrome oxidase subunit CtaJ n=1 Tax=Rhodococcus sp. X156 TaxID=2499145 RepID=UPI000FD7137E|nr:hypothetical protein [Rhodococcus sp. X156]
MTIAETVLIYVGIPVGVLVLFALLTMVPNTRNKAPRYKSGESWDFAPMWWSANPAGVEGDTHHDLPELGQREGAHAAAGVVGGGARGTW